jgi:radical SAM superfamily enzyme YgiQ (UPF0313 family)
MKVLLIYPKYPDTFWSFKYALKFIRKKAANVPLGVLTVASMMPSEWDKKLVDMNVDNLTDRDLKRADYVFISAMSIQRESVLCVLNRCKAMGVKVVAGGPIFTTGYKEFENLVDHFVLDEAEITFPLFLEDLKKGQLKKLYSANSQWADLTKTSIPMWELVNMNKYASIGIQYSRGCPFNCEFCNITSLFGRIPRTKTKEQLIAELEAIYQQGWRAGVFFVDDNFIGNKRKLKQEILPAITEWMDSRNHPFFLSTEASVDLADDEQLMQMMVRAGFDTVFVGIETPNEESLMECNKFHNKNRDLIACVKKIHSFGMQVQGGFILGFDSDPASIFERLIGFIQESGIVTAMVGLLNAPTGTRLYHRLAEENRLINNFTGDNTDLSMNFIPKMNQKALISGYKKVLDTIYSPVHYYERLMLFFKEYQPVQKRVFRFHSYYIGALFKSILYLGIIGKERYYYWKLFFWSLFKRPKLFPIAITLSIYGFHFRKVFEHNMAKMQ